MQRVLLQSFSHSVPLQSFLYSSLRCSATTVLRFHVKDKDCCCCSTPLTDIKKPKKQMSNKPASILACSFFYSHFSFIQEKASKTNKQTKNPPDLHLAYIVKSTWYLLLQAVSLLQIVFSIREVVQHLKRHFSFYMMPVLGVSPNNILENTTDG